MAHQPVGAGFSFATNQTSASQTFTVQSDTLRVVAKNAGQHVAIGTTGPATTTDYYVPANSSATLNLGRVSSIGVVSARQCRYLSSTTTFTTRKPKIFHH